MIPEIPHEDILFSILVLQDGTMITTGHGSDPKDLPAALRYIADAIESGSTEMTRLFPPTSLN